MNLDIKADPHPGRVRLLVDDPDRGADRHGVEQLFDVLGVKMDAAMADIAADAVGLVGAVDQIIAPAEPQRVIAERVVGAGTDRRRQSRLLLADRGGRDPGRA